MAGNTDIDWSGELVTDDGSDVDYVGPLPADSRTAWDHIIIVGSFGTVCFASDNGQFIQIGNGLSGRIVNAAPEPAPLPPERWVTLTKTDGDENVDDWVDLPSAQKAAKAWSRCFGNEVWFGQLRQFRVDDSPIDGLEPAGDEEWVALTKHDGLTWLVGHGATREEALADCREDKKPPTHVAHLQPVSTEPGDE